MAIDPKQTDFTRELASLHAEIEGLHRQVEKLQENQYKSFQAEIGWRSYQGLRRLGGLMYILTLPLAISADIYRKLRLALDYWKNYYAFSFTFVLLSRKEKRLFTRIIRFFPTFLLLRSKLK